VCFFFHYFFLTVLFLCSFQYFLLLFEYCRIQLLHTCYCMSSCICKNMGHLNCLCMRFIRLWKEMQYKFSYIERYLAHVSVNIKLKQMFVFLPQYLTEICILLHRVFLYSFFHSYTVGAVWPVTCQCGVKSKQTNTPAVIRINMKHSHLNVSNIYRVLFEFAMSFLWIWNNRTMHNVLYAYMYIYRIHAMQQCKLFLVKTIIHLRMTETSTNLFRNQFLIFIAKFQERSKLFDAPPTRHTHFSHQNLT
jgi:hypothetical protein